MFIEILTILWKSFWGVLCGIGDAVIGMLPSIMEFKKITGYFTPAGMIGLYIGVPTFIVAIVLTLVRKALAKKKA